jgi:hypothetical protein
MSLVPSTSDRVAPTPYPGAGRPRIGVLPGGLVTAAVVTASAVSGVLVVIAALRGNLGSIIGFF